MFNGKMKAITFSFDDGVTQDIKLIEIMNKYGLKGTFNLNSDRFGRQGNFYVANNGVTVYRNIIEKELVPEIYRGHEVAVHTLTHPLLPSLDEAEIIRQVEQDRLNLSELLGYEVVGMAYPGGGVNNDDRVAEIIKNNTGVKYSRTTTSTGKFDPQDYLLRFNPTTSYGNFDRVRELADEFFALDTDTPKIFYIWGHSYEMDEANKWDKLDELFSYLAGHDDVFYGTNKEVLLCK